MKSDPKIFVLLEATPFPHLFWSLLVTPSLWSNFSAPHYPQITYSHLLANPPKSNHVANHVYPYCPFLVGVIKLVGNRRSFNSAFNAVASSCFFMEIGAPPPPLRQH